MSKGLTFQKWCQYQKTLNKYDKLVLRIEEMINEEKFHEISLSLRNSLLRRLKLLFKRLQRFKLSFGLKIVAAALAFSLITNYTYSADINFKQRKGTSNPFINIDVGSMSRPAFVDVDNDGDADLFIGNTSGTIKYYKNESTSSNIIFTEQTGANNPFNGVNLTYEVLPAFVDIDNDGDFDCFIGSTYNYANYYPTIYYYKNTGNSSSATFTAQDSASNPFHDYALFNNYYVSAAPTFADIDNDGDYDCYVGFYEIVSGSYYAVIQTIINTGTANSATFTGLTNPPGDLNTIGNGYHYNSISPTLMDIDDDGDYDCLVGTRFYDTNESVLYNRVFYYENSGTAGTANFTKRANSLNPFVDVDFSGYGDYSSITFADIDGDSDLDAVIGVGSGKLIFMENVQDEEQGMSFLDDAEIIYSNIARSSDGTILINQYISLKLGIYNTSDLNNPVFEETHTLETNRFGLFSCQIGQGDTTVVSDIDVASNKYIVKASIDPSTPYSTYTEIEQRELLALVMQSVLAVGSGGGSSKTPSSTGSGSASSGELRAFSSMVERDGWTYTERSETVGTPDTWTTMSWTGAPSVRTGIGYTSVWTGSEIIIWGGDDGVNELATGAKYNPSNKTWSVISTTNAPSARTGHLTAWTGTEMIVWGGYDGTNYVTTGSRYKPSTDTWSSISNTNAPDSKVANMSTRAVWTGTEMIVWGGYDVSYTNAGARYNPATDTWTAMSTTAAPAIRNSHTLLWTGSEMIVWGGYNGTTYLNTGGKYNPTTDIWTTVSTASAPTGRSNHTAVWDGNKMIIWGGLTGTTTTTNTGGVYDPKSDSWTSTSSASLTPASRTNHSAIWTGEEMVIWSGKYYTSNWAYLNNGGRYNPSDNTWSSLASVNAPSSRNDVCYVWTGKEFIVWGGAYFAVELSTGGILGGAMTIYWYKKD